MKLDNTGFTAKFYYYLISSLNKWKFLESCRLTGTHTGPGTGAVQQQLYIYIYSSDAKASKCHLKFSSLMRIFINLVYLSLVISLK